MSVLDSTLGSPERPGRAPPALPQRPGAAAAARAAAPQQQQQALRPAASPRPAAASAAFRGYSGAEGLSDDSSVDDIVPAGHSAAATCACSRESPRSLPEPVVIPRLCLCSAADCPCLRTTPSSSPAFQALRVVGAQQERLPPHEPARARPQRRSPQRLLSLCCLRRGAVVCRRRSRQRRGAAGRTDAAAGADAGRRGARGSGGVFGEAQHSG